MIPDHSYPSDAMFLARQCMLLSAEKEGDIETVNHTQLGKLKDVGVKFDILKESILSNDIFLYKQFVNEFKSTSKILTIDNFINEKSVTKDKSVDHIENIEINDDSNEDADEDIKKYVDDNSELCPRCKEHSKDCVCSEEDPWSTQNYHRVPKGKVKTEKPKQNFKQS